MWKDFADLLTGMSDQGEADPDVVEAEVMSWLTELQADKLEALCTEIGLECAVAMKGKKKLLFRFVLKHLLDLEASEDAKAHQNSYKFTHI